MSVVGASDGSLGIGYSSSEPGRGSVSLVGVGGQHGGGTLREDLKEGGKSVRWGKTTVSSTIDSARKAVEEVGGERAWSKGGVEGVGGEEDDDDDADYTEAPNSIHFVKPNKPPYLGGVLKHYDKVKVTDEYGYR